MSRVLGLVAAFAASLPAMANAVAKEDASTALRRVFTSAKALYVLEMDIPKTEVAIPPGASFETAMVEIWKQSGVSVLPVTAPHRLVQPPRFGYLPDAALAADQGLLLVFRGSKRSEDRTTVVLEFELIANGRMPDWQFQQKLELVSGSAESKTPKSLTTGDNAPVRDFRARRWTIYVTLAGIADDITALKDSTFQLPFRASGTQVDKKFAEFRFSRLPF